MAGISIIGRAKDYALRIIPGATNQPQFERVIAAVMDISRAAHQRRLAYRGNPAARKLIQYTDMCASTVAEVLFDVSTHWNQLTPDQISSILLMLVFTVNHIDGTPFLSKDEPSPEAIDQVAATFATKVRAMLPPKEIPHDTISRDMAKIISPSAVLIEPSADDNMSSAEPVYGE